MPTQRRSTVSDFTARGVVFSCWLVGIGDPVAPEDGEPAGRAAAVSPGRYEWRSGCGRMRAGRDGRDWWAAVDGRRLGGRQYTLLLAMEAAVAAMR